MSRRFALAFLVMGSVVASSQAVLAADAVYVAPNSDGTIYPSNFYALPQPPQRAPYETANLRNHEQRAVYERWNAWLSNPDRPAYLIGDEPFRMGLQVKQIDYKDIAKHMASKQEPPLNTGGIGKVGGKKQSGTKDQDGKMPDKSAAKTGAAKTEKTATSAPKTSPAPAANNAQKPAEVGGSSGGIGSVGGVGKVGTSGR